MLSHLSDDVQAGWVSVRDAMLRFLSCQVGGARHTPSGAVVSAVRIAGSPSYAASDALAVLDSSMRLNPAGTHVSKEVFRG